MTGALASAAEPLSVGVLDYLKYVNDELGGVEYRDPQTGKADRVRLDLMWEDSGYNAARALSIYKRQAAAGAIMMHLTAGSMVEATLASINSDYMPVVYAVPASPLAIGSKPIYTLAEESNYADLDGAFLDWVKANWTQSRPPKVALFHVESPMARGIITRPDLAQYAAKIGVDLLPVEWLPYALTDTSIELNRVIKGGADFLYINHVPGAVSVIVKDWLRLGLKDKLKLVVVTYAFDESLSKLAPMDGVYGQQSTVLGSDTGPGVTLAKQINSRYNPGRPTGILYIKGIRLGMVMVQGLKDALDKVGYDRLTRDAIATALINMKDFDSGGIGPKATIDPSYPIYAPFLRFYQFQGSDIKMVQDWAPAPAVVR